MGVRSPEVCRFEVILEGRSGSYSAYVPDLPGCVAAGPTARAVEQRIAEAVQAHVNELLRSGEPLPATRPTRRSGRWGAVLVDPLAVRFQADRRPAR